MASGDKKPLLSWNVAAGYFEVFRRKNQGFEKQWDSLEMAIGYWKKHKMHGEDKTC